VLSHSTHQGVGLGYVAVEAAKAGTDIEVVIRDRPIPARVVKPPFYTEGSLRR
jgi:aminomethyltransferase